jgi:alanine racemase
MDSCVVDVTDIDGIDRASVFTLLGSDGADAITLEEISQRAGTIPQEMAVAFDSRLPHTYAEPGNDRVLGA